MTVKIDNILMGKEKIEEILPHRDPMILIDCVSELNKERIVAHLNLTGDEFFFQGHFPGDPTMPGVMMIESIAQSSAILFLADKEDLRGKSVLFTGIESGKFRRKVRPGETLRCEVKLDSLKEKRGRYFAKFQGRAYVGDELAVETVIKATIEI